MLCEQCHEREATNHLTSFVGDVKHTRDVCTQCLETSNSPESQFAASMRDAPCDFCGEFANIGFTDHLALSVGEQRFTNLCFRCSEEFDRYTSAAMKRLSPDLPREQQLDAIRQLRQDAERHMREWLSRRLQ
jgi:protein-arginine kinase activator protein McsA